MTRAPILRKGLIWRILIFGFVWVLLTGGALESWIIGIPSIFLALFVNAYLPPIAFFKISPKGAVLFLIYFLKQSFMAGIDVAKRVFDPRLPLDPGFVEYQTRLSSEWAQIFFLNTISLLPGTLSARFKNGVLVVHVLDKAQPAYENLKIIEDKIGSVFCEGVE
ncbi:MAG: Na+/H+ antiporter subunit E [Waddliaceae bacterium]